MVPLVVLYTAIDPTKAAMAPGARFRENAQAVSIGDRLWKTASEVPTNFEGV
jgi:hypothetical protein